MTKDKTVSYTVKIQRENSKNTWVVYCECMTQQLAEDVASRLNVPYIISEKTVETTIRVIKIQDGEVRDR